MIIFDFDQTLVDTSRAEALRSAGKWGLVMAQVEAGNLPVYPGITELLATLHAKDHKLAILTKSPDMIPKWFVREHKWPIAFVLGFHQVKKRKPDPEGLLLAMNAAGAQPENTYHIGDQVHDTEASRAANVTAIGAAWGIQSKADLQASSPDFLFDTISQLQNFFSEKDA